MNDSDLPEQNAATLADLMYTPADDGPSWRPCSADVACRCPTGLILRLRLLSYEQPVTASCRRLCLKRAGHRWLGVHAVSPRSVPYGQLHRVPFTNPFTAVPSNRDYRRRHTST